MRHGGGYRSVGGCKRSDGGGDGCETLLFFIFSIKSMQIGNLNSHFRPFKRPSPFYYPIDDKRRRRGICNYVRGHERGVDRAENARVRHRCENGQCVPQPRQRQTIAIHQTMAGGVGSWMEVEGRLYIVW